MLPIARPVLAALVIAVGGGGVPMRVAAQSANPLLQSDLIRTLELSLRHDLEDGAVVMGRLYAIELDLALNGKLTSGTQEKIQRMEEMPDSRRGDPALTSHVLPWMDHLSDAISANNLAGARTQSYKIVAEMGEIHKLFLSREIQAERAQQAKVSSSEGDQYDEVSDQLENALFQGDMAQAMVLVTKVQALERSLPKSATSAFNIARNIYNVNDALGRDAFLRKDYEAAGDFLLKSADTPGNAVLNSFGPNLWLAQALLTKGRKDVVLLFLQRCKAFWLNKD